MADQSNPLLDFLGGLSQGVQEIAAYRQAALGNPAPVQMMQEQQQRKNLLNQLQSMSQQEMEGPFGQTLQRQLQFGDISGAQKTLINLPQYKQFEASLEDPSLGLSESQKKAAKTLGALDPGSAQEYLKTALRLSGEEQKQTRVMEKTFAQRQALEEKKMQRLEAKLPGNLVAKAIEDGQVQPDDIQGIVGLLQASGVRLPENENDARIFASRILSSPKVKKLIPQQEQKTWGQRFKGFFTKPAQQQTAPVSPMQTQEQKMQRLQELLRKQQGE